jgi:hypothetical protein
MGTFRCCSWPRPRKAKSSIRSGRCLAAVGILAKDTRIPSCVLGSGCCASSLQCRRNKNVDNSAQETQVPTFVLGSSCSVSSLRCHGGCIRSICLGLLAIFHTCFHTAISPVSFNFALDTSLSLSQLSLLLPLLVFMLVSAARGSARILVPYDSTLILESLIPIGRRPISRCAR